MPKPRAPISTRLRNRDKNGERIETPKPAPVLERVEKKQRVTKKNKKVKHEEEFIQKKQEEELSKKEQPEEEFSPKKHPEIYMDELQSPLSFVRGTDVERNEFLMNEDAIMSHSFGSDYKSSINTSSFYLARVTPPVPSKRTRHLKIHTQSGSDSRYSTDTLTPSPTATTRYTSSSSNSPSVSSLSPTPTPSTKKNTRIKSTPPAPTVTLTPTQLMLAAAAKLKKSKLPQTKSKSPKLQSPKINKPKPTKLTKLTKSKAVKTPIKETEEENVPIVPLPVPSELPIDSEMDAKEKEREYWRRQRRVFVNSRYITNEEGVIIAKSVYSNLTIHTDNRIISSFQGNIGNFRTKLRKAFINQAGNFNLTKEYVTNTNHSKLLGHVKSKMDTRDLEVIWDHWIADPFIDTDAFYGDEETVNKLIDVTAQLMVVSIKEHYGIYAPKEAQLEMRKIDLISRTLILPDPFDFEF